MNNKAKVMVKPQNKGKFTKYCKGLGFNRVTAKCIAQGKKSKNPDVRRRATFAASARKWK